MKNEFSFRHLGQDLPAALVVFLVALPLCLGIALASGAPLMSGIVAGIVGGVVIGALSGSALSVSGPAAGLAAVVLTSIASLGSFEAFLTAVVIAGLLQIALGVLKAGLIADYFPSNVIKGLLAAIGLILILKQLPHFVGWDADAEGEMSFVQGDDYNSFSAVFAAFEHIQVGALIVAIVSVCILVFWEKTPLARFKFLPAPLIVVAIGILLNDFFAASYPDLTIASTHLVTIPAVSLSTLSTSIVFPDFSILSSVKIYTVAATVAIVASLETLLNLEATDGLDPQQRHTPPNRELIAQGIGNMVSGLFGGLPLTSVIVRSSVNVNAGAMTKLSAIIHGIMILISILLVPGLINKIPLSALAAILIVTGFKLAKPALFIKEYKKGWNQFLPFMATIIAILFTDLLVGIVIGLLFSLAFILKSNYLNSFVFVTEKHHAGELIRINLAQQVSFLNKATIMEALSAIPNDTQVVIDASESDYIDFEIRELIQTFAFVQAPPRGITVSLMGFKSEYSINDVIHFSSAITKDIQERLTPVEALQLLKDGNERFLSDTRIHRNLMSQVRETADGQHPIAAIVGCIDSRTTSELIFDAGLGEIFSVRVAGNVANIDVVGSLEFACKVAGAKLIVVLGHTNCGAVKAACDGVELGNITPLLNKIQPAVQSETRTKENRTSSNHHFVDTVAHLNVGFTRQAILEQSPLLRTMLDSGEILIVGGMYDVGTGKVVFDEAVVKA